jgi:hypothetical protein
VQLYQPCGDLVDLGDCSHFRRWQIALLSKNSIQTRTLDPPGKWRQLELVRVRGQELQRPDLLRLALARALRPPDRERIHLKDNPRELLVLVQK